MLKLLLIFCGLCSIVFLQPVNGFGKVMFVTDHIEITFRTGPGLENRIIGMLPSGTKLDAKDKQGDWYLVVPMEGPFKGKEGWVLARYLSYSKPKQVALREIKEENLALKKKVAEYEKQVQTLRSSVEQLTNELSRTKTDLEKIQNDYTLLRTESADFLNMKKKLGNLQRELSQLKVINQRLTKENQELKSSENLKWFISGAGVLLCGWLIGLVMGKRRKKRPYLY